MRKLYVLVVASLLMMTACVDGTPVGLRLEEPELSGSDLEVVGFWSKINGSKTDGLICPINLTIRAPSPITITGGELNVVIGDILVRTWVNLLEEEELIKIWGGLRVMGTKTTTVAFSPPVLGVGYEAVARFNWDTGLKTGSFSHSWQCIKPELAPSYHPFLAIPNWELTEWELTKR